MPVAAGISAVGSIGSGLLGYFGSQNAAKTLQAGYNSALQYGRDIYNQSSANLSPYMTLGTNAVSSLSDLYGLGGKGASGVNDAFNAFTNLPSYQFPYQQGLLALNRTLNAQGRQQSGAQVKESENYGSGLASTYLMNNYVTPLTGFANQGQAAASTLATVGAQSMPSFMGAITGSAGAGAAGIMGGANALGGALTNFTNNYGSLAAFSKLASGGFGGSPTNSMASSYGSLPSGTPAPGTLGMSPNGFNAQGQWFGS